MLCCLLQTLLAHGLTGLCSHTNSPFHPLFLSCSFSLLALQIVWMSPFLAFHSLPWTPTMTQSAPLSYEYHQSFVHTAAPWHDLFLSGISVFAPAHITLMFLPLILLSLVPLCKHPAWTLNSCEVTNARILYSVVLELLWNLTIRNKNSKWLWERKFNTALAEM